MHNYAKQATILFEKKIKTLVYCAFSILCNNWAITEYAVKDVFVVGHKVGTLLDNADLNLACSPQFWAGLEFHITAV